ncbi:hypothetical protein GCM10027277_32770 [Pseudoduganella ginsengisoli]|uniref:Uncharacterized protein n=1 Tax=Pseudoduganella ginsengisoli TaxID=1462440 RepID=A0A6L6Q771_9BURK|nr:hypothetical protein [Pseudoduganella ginsengisoli]MTW05617.1 hypothetical protein [Pseudoduganella ginsengisoli]
MNALLFASLLSAANFDADYDLRFYPPDPETVDARKLPYLVSGLVVGTTFTAARKQILKQGWRPYNLLKTWRADEQPDCVLLDCELHRNGVVEVEGCPTDKPVCTFYYRKGKVWLQLMATGETRETLRVYYWAKQAPPSSH